jgi:hypothetical protein
MLSCSQSAPLEMLAISIGSRLGSPLLTPKTNMIHMTVFLGSHILGCCQKFYLPASDHMGKYARTFPEKRFGCSSYQSKKAGYII